VGWNDWIRTVEVEPSLYAADFAHLGDQIDVLLRAGVRIFHFDVGDGHFVEPITIGPIVIGSMKCPSPTSKWKMRTPARISTSIWSARCPKSAA